MVLKAPLGPAHAEVMLVPGATTSVHVPWLLKLLRLSDLSLDMTVTMPPPRALPPALAGEKLQAFEFWLPAATTTMCPALAAAIAAALRAAFLPPPSDLVQV